MTAIELVKNPTSIVILSRPLAWSNTSTSGQVISVARGAIAHPEAGQFSDQHLGQKESTMSLSDSIIKVLENSTTAVTASTIAVGLSAAGGYFLRKLRETTRFFPNGNNRRAFEFLSGEWHEFHFTCDERCQPGVFLSHSDMKLEVRRDLGIVGRATYRVPDRMNLEMNIRGEIRDGRCYYVGVCAQNPGDVFTVIVRNMLSDQRLIGVHAGIDWNGRPYVSPMLLNKESLEEAKAIEILRSTKDIAMYADGNVVWPEPELARNL